jgi:preprotein translocase subunit YajC
MNLDNNLTKILLAVIALIAAGIIIKISINRKNKKVKQSHNKVTNGDIVAGDKVGGNKTTK